MLKVYDVSMNLVAYLENAFGIGYEERYNELWNAQFSLPADDPKNAECISLRFVEFFDGDERVDLFRIVPTKTQRSTDGQKIDYQCEHVLGTLLDDVLFQYHQAGGSGFDTSDVLAFILSNQAVGRWQLGTVAFTNEYEYKWENENLLASVFAVPKPFDQQHHWTWDTSSYPWTLNLVEPEQDESCYIRYGKNLKGITKEVDPTTICTRLYGLGYGEGVNQLGIKSANPTGLPYIDASTIATYGVVSKIYVDRKQESEATLYAATLAQLEELKVPRITYSVDGAEIYQLTNDPIDRFKSGALVRVIDEELGINIVSRVIVRSRPDINGSPGDVKLEIANKTLNIAGSIAQLQDRQRINEVYAQGATNLDSHDFADNCDLTHPAVIRFYLPEETVRINKLTLNYKSEAFRAYSKANEFGGYSVQTTTNGNSYTIDGNGATKPANNLITGGMIWGDYIGGMIKTSDAVATYTSSNGTHGHGASTDPGGDPEHTHGVNIGPGGSHSHSVTVPAHTHDIVSHSHYIDHEHNVTLPAHTHDIIYGIYEGPTPTSITVEVDGVAVPGLGVNVNNVDIIPYLSKDAGGKINRGQWHEIKITPNSLGRIVANIVNQFFVQSRGGGNY